MTFGYKDNFHFRAIGKEDEKIVRNIIFPILENYGLKVDVEGVDGDLYDIVSYYESGLFGVVEIKDSQEIIGSFALFPISDQEVELRKMYLKKEYRGHGIGKWIINFCEAYAKRQGYSLMTLETASALKEAIGLYYKMGFTKSEANNHTDRCDIMMEKKL